MILAALPQGKELTLNQKILPGIVRSVNVSARMQADRNVRADGGRDFTLKGWEPAEVSVEAVLLGKGAEELDTVLENVVALFKKTEGGEAVQYELSFPQTRSWGIGRCYLTELASNQGSAQSYRVSLKFVEFRPEIDQVKRQQGEQAADPNAPAGPAPASPPLLSREQQTPEKGTPYPADQEQSPPFNVIDSKTLSSYNAELDDLLQLSRPDLDKALVASKVSEVQTKIQRLMHRMGVDKGNYIERAKAKEILLEGLQAIVSPLVNFGASPIAERLSEIYLEKIPLEEQKQKASELMTEYVMSFEETLVRCEQELDKA